jgi:2-aminoadipate transaminase
MVTEALCNPGDIMLVEDPTYFVFRGIMQSHGLQARAIRLTNYGIDLSHLEEVLRSLERSGDLPRVKMLYLVSYFQNPTGITTDFENKVGALRLLRKFERAAGHPLYLLEDGAYRELRFTGEDIPSSMVATNFASRIIYTSTYSKPYATGVRVGYGLLPEPLFTVVRRIKGNHDFGTANFLQHLLARVLESGVYKEHVQELRARYAYKAQVMTTALRKHFPVQWDEPRGGLYVWAKLPPAIKSGVKSKFFQRALKNDVLYVPGELCYADDPTRPKPNHEMRLSFGNATEQEIQAGVARLGEVLSGML